jgi:hypothetical protein
MDKHSSNIEETVTQHKRIKKCICMSGGGGSISCFILGALLRLSEVSNATSKNDKVNGRYVSFLEDVDVFSGVSGSNIIMHIIQLMISVKKNAHLLKEEDWYRRYIIKTVHKFYKYTVFQKLLIKMLNPYNWINFQNTINSVGEDLIKQFDDSDGFDKSLIGTEIVCGLNKKPRYNFLYNYFNATTSNLDYNHSDLLYYSKKNRMFKSSKDNVLAYVTRMARCIFPLSRFGDIFAYDGGMLDNTGLSTVLHNYDPDELIIITHQNNMSVTKEEKINILAKIFKHIYSNKNNED